MSLIILFARKLSVAHGAMKLFLGIVILEMQGQIRPIPKGFRALRARKRLLGVRALMQHHTPFARSDDFPANVTLFSKRVKMDRGLVAF